MKSPITTHVLDTTLGKPAQNIEVTLEISESGAWRTLGQGVTNSDGRVTDLLAPDFILQKGLYRITFATGSYFRACGVVGFYPTVPIIFEVHNGEQHYHVPLLLNPFGYSTYRGS
jgi:5-hydroxyisourate hydrolase